MALILALLLFITTTAGIGFSVGRFQKKDHLGAAASIVGTLALGGGILWLILRINKAKIPRLPREKINLRSRVYANFFGGLDAELVDPAVEDPQVYDYFRSREWPYAALAIDGEQRNVLFVKNSLAEDLSAADFQMIGRARALHNIDFNEELLDDGALLLIAEAPQLRGIAADISAATEAGILALAKHKTFQEFHFIEAPEIPPAVWQQLLGKPNLKKIAFESSPLRDDYFDGLRDSPTIRSVVLARNNGLTDRIFDIFGTLKNLDCFRLTGDEPRDQLTPAGAFRMIQQRLPKEFKLRDDLLDDRVWKRMIAGGWLYGQHPQAQLFCEIPYPRTASEVNSISFADSQIGDEGFTAVADCINAENLRFDDSQITDATLKRLGNFKKLRNLCLQGTKITARGLLAVVDCPVNFIRLDKTELTEDCFKVLGRMRTLSEIHLDQAKMRVTWVKHLGQMPNLKTLLITGQQLTPEDIEVITTLRNVKKLSFQRTNLDNAGFAKIFSMPQLEELSVDKTNVSESLCEKARAKRPNLWIFSGRKST